MKIFASAFFSIILSLIFIFNIYSKDESTYNPSEQIKWYDAKWFDWYDALSPELQSKVNLPVFSDWDTNNRIWFECYNSMRPEDQSRVKFLNYQEWYNQTYKWLEWYDSLTFKMQNEIDLPGTRVWFDWFNSEPPDRQGSFSARLYDFARIQKDVYGVDVGYRDEEPKIITPSAPSDRFVPTLTPTPDGLVPTLTPIPTASTSGLSYVDNILSPPNNSIIFESGLIKEHFGSSIYAANSNSRFVDGTDLIVPLNRDVRSNYGFRLILENAQWMFQNDIQPTLSTFSPKYGNLSGGIYTRSTSNSLVGKDIDHSKTVVDGITYSEGQYTLEIFTENNQSDWEESWDIVSQITVLHDYSLSDNIIFRIPLATFIEDSNKTAYVTVDPGGPTGVLYCNLAYTKQTTIEKVIIALAIDDKTYIRNGKIFELDVPPYISSDNRTMVPIRFIAEGFGAKVTWLDSEKTSVIELNGNTIRCKVSETLPYNMGTPVLKDDRLFVPVRYIMAALGANVDWDARESKVTVTMDVVSDNLD